MTEAVRVGIVGSAGAYGRWLGCFFRERLGLEVLGHDPVDDASLPLDTLLDKADVLVFSVPIRSTVEVIDRCVAASAGREAGRLWLDLTSIKQAPVEAMLASRAEVVGLHPMAAPPKTPTLRGRTLAVCEARLDHWHGWIQRLLEALEAQCVAIEPDAHDRAMALVQGLVHAGHLGQAEVLAEMAGADGPAGLLALRTVGYELDLSTTSRMLSLNPQIYQDIQFCNPHVGEVLALFSDRLSSLRDAVARGDAPARAGFQARFEAARQAFGAPLLEEGNYTFERVGYLLADLSGPALAVRLPRDEVGSLRHLLEAFETHAVNLVSLHSSRTPEGQVHFRIGIDPATPAGNLRAAVQAINGGLGEVIEALSLQP